MRRTSRLSLAALILLIPPGSMSQSESVAIKPTQTIHVFDGKSLEPFDSWLVDLKRTDPDRVFSVVDRIDGAPAIRVSGQHYGGLITKQRYRDYRLVVEYRWGAATWKPRRDQARDNGVLLHCQGRPGNYAKDFNGPWMRSIELQIIEGGVGDILLVGGYDEKGELHRPSLTAKTRKGRNGGTFFDPKGEAGQHSSQRINWWGRSEDWVDKLGFRGPSDPDSPGQEWTRIEAVVDGGHLAYYVNGTLVNEASECSLQEGKLLFQSEGAEIYFRRIDLEPLK